MICNTLAQIAVLTAKNEGIKAVYFSGGFLREKGYVWEKLQHAVNYWSHGKLEARFVVHDSYLGAIGALLDNEGRSSKNAIRNVSSGGCETRTKTFLGRGQSRRQSFSIV